MVRIRCLELGLRELFQKIRRDAAASGGGRLVAYQYGSPDLGPELQGNLELAVGQEPTAAAILHLRRTDYLGAAHRAHHAAIAKGVSMRSLVAELFGRVDGLCGGRAGDFTLHDVSTNFETSPIVGQLLPVATGHALAARLQGRDDIAVACVGDGAMNQGSFHEAANLAGLWKLPVVFLVENNGYALSVTVDRSSALIPLAERAHAYELEVQRVDDNDPIAIHEAMGTAVARARAGEGPSFIEVVTDRLAGAFEGDKQLYRPAGELERLEERDALQHFERMLQGSGALTDDVRADVWSRARAEVKDAIAFGSASELPDPREAFDHVFAGRPAGGTVTADRPLEANDSSGHNSSPTTTPTPDVRPLSYRDAINEALAGEMERDPAVFVMGEDIAVMGGIHGHMRGLYEAFGDQRVRDTPISEAGFIGAASGAAVEGLRPVVELMTVDFFGVAMDQLYNYMAKVHSASGGTRRVPIVVLASTGNPLRQGVTHSQTLHGLFAHLPGLKVVAPSSPYDAKGLLASAIRDDNPVIYLFHRALLPTFAATDQPEGMEHVPREPYEVELGKARVHRAGADITIATVSYMVHEVMRTVPQLEQEGIDAEVLDMRTLVPLDVEGLLQSVRRTRRLLVVDEDYRSFGMSGELIAAVAERDVPLRQPPARVARADAPIPYARRLEDAVMVTPEKIVAAARRLMTGK
jgi:2-oxoisovalerate dehydrogenase E1 component